MLQPRSIVVKSRTSNLSTLILLKIELTPTPPPPCSASGKEIVMHGGGGLAPLAQQPPEAEPLIPVRRKRKRPALSAQTWMVGSEDEERSLRRDERRAGWGRRCGVRLGRHRIEADCPSLPSGEGRGLITPLYPYSPPSPRGS